MEAGLLTTTDTLRSLNGTINHMDRKLDAVLEREAKGDGRRELLVSFITWLPAGISAVAAIIMLLAIRPH